MQMTWAFLSYLNLFPSKNKFFLEANNFVLNISGFSYTVCYTIWTSCNTLKAFIWSQASARFKLRFIKGRSWTKIVQIIWKYSIMHLVYAAIKVDQTKYKKERERDTMTAEKFSSRRTPAQLLMGGSSLCCHRQKIRERLVLWCGFSDGSLCLLPFPGVWASW